MFHNPQTLLGGGIVAVLSRQDLESWLSTLDYEERRSMKLLWEKYVTRDSPNAVLRFSNGIRNELRDLASSFMANRITLQQWYDESRRLMKQSYITVIEKQSQTLDNTKVVAAIILYFLFLNNFFLGVMGGIIPVNGRLVPRMGMYGSAVYSVSMNWTLAGMFGKNMEAKRVLGPNENHCYPQGDTEGCIELAERGWMPVEAMPKIGESTTCRSNCRCSILYREKPPITLL
jgi:hypothetical protein